MTEAIFGLVGVVVGGLLTAGLDWWRRRVDERGARRLAARILVDELAALGAAHSHRNYKVFVGAANRLVAAWREYRTALATLRHHDWNEIQATVFVAEMLNERWADSPELWSDFDRSEKRIDAAIKRLGPYLD
jgi:hypothetical protein